MVIFKQGRAVPKLGCVMLCAFWVGSGAAQELMEGFSPMVVTATGQEQPIFDVISAAQVIERDEIERFAGASIAEVLRYATGAAVFSSGSTESVRLRGFGSNQTLVLVDGQRRASRLGGQNIANIPVSEIERIEIIRGPMSALYGADALGGVVNLITRRAQNTQEAEVRTVVGVADGGGRETFLGSVSLGTVTERSSHRFNVEYRDRAALGDPQTPADELNAHELMALSQRSAFELGGDHWLDVSVEYQDQDDEGTRYVAPRGPVPGSTYQGLEQEERYFIGTRLGGPVAEQTDYSVSLGYSDTNGANRRQPGLIETTDYQLMQADARLYHYLDTSTLTLGAGGLREAVDINTNTDNARRTNRYLLAQNEWQLSENVNTILGLRHDDYTDFGSTTNPRLGATWQVGEWQLRGNVGTGFRAPTSLEQYSSFVRGVSLITGNEELSAEKARMVDVGARWQSAQTSLDISAFDSRVRNLIGTQPIGEVRNGLNVLEYTNVSRAHLRGLEVDALQQLAPWLSVSARYSYLDARDQDSNERLTGRTRHSGQLATTVYGSDWHTELRVLRLNGFYNNGSPQEAPTSSNYTRLDLYSEWQPVPRWTLFAGIDNLLDRADPDTAARTITTDPGGRYYWAGAQWSY